MKKMLLLMASAAILVVPFAGPAAADDVAWCEVGVIVHEEPSVSTDPIVVQTGKYEPYTDCTQDPPIVIQPICLTKPPICLT